VTTYWLVTLSRYAKSVIVFVVACSWVAGVAAQSELNELPQVVLEHEHGGQVVFLGVIEDGRQLISVDYNGGVYVWDAQTMRQVSTERRVPFSVRTVMVN
jgi:hypothetical protein